MTEGLRKSRTSLYLVICSVILCSCEKITKKIENYDLFGLEQANKGMQMQQEKIRAAREHQRSMRTIREDAYNSPNILGGQQ